MLILRDKAFSIVKVQKIMDIYVGWFKVLWIFDKKNSNTNKGTGISSENKQLAEELQKSIIRKFEKRKVNSPFIDSIWGTDLADMQLSSKFDKGISFLLYVTYIYSKYALDKEKVLQGQKKVLQLLTLLRNF